MCVVSMVGDFYGERFSPYKPWIQPDKGTATEIIISPTPPSRQEVDDLRKEVEVMKEMLRRAKIYDEENDEPNCEIEEKIEFLRGVAKFVGIDLDDILNKKNDA